MRMLVFVISREFRFVFLNLNPVEKLHVPKNKILLLTTKNTFLNTVRFHIVYLSTVTNETKIRISIKLIVRTNRVAKNGKKQ